MMKKMWKFVNLSVCFRNQVHSRCLIKNSAHKKWHSQFADWRLFLFHCFAIASDQKTTVRIFFLEQWVLSSSFYHFIKQISLKSKSKVSREVSNSDSAWTFDRHLHSECLNKQDQVNVAYVNLLIQLRRMRTEKRDRLPIIPCRILRACII